jgi:ATP-dependent helicase/DNAse subunit B
MKVLVGPANSGKSNWLLSQVAEALSNRRSAMLIVPSNIAASEFSRQLQDVAGHEGAESPRQVINTFPNLYYRILSVEKKPLVQVSLTDRSIILRDVIEELNSRCELVHFNSIAETQGFAGGVASFIDELSRSGTDPTAFFRFARVRQDKDLDLAKIFEAYSKELTDREATDSEAAALVALIALNKRLGGLGGSPVQTIEKEYDLSLVVADGFDYYTPVQVAILGALSKLGIATMAALTFRSGNSVHLWQEPTWRRFERAGAEIVHFEPLKESKMQVVADSLFSDQPVDAERSNEYPRSNIKSISLPDRAAEVREVAREVKRLIIKERFELDEITIVCRSFHHYSRQLERIFEECEVPLWLDCGIGLADQPLITTLLRLLDLQSGSLRRRAVLACLRSPFIDISAIDLTDADIELLEYVSAVENVTRGSNQWFDALTRAASIPSTHDYKDNEELLDGSADVRRARIDALGNKLKHFFDMVSPMPEATFREHAQWIKDLLSKLKVADRIAAGATSPVEIRALESFQRILDLLVPKMIRRTAKGRSFDPPVEWSRFWNDLNRAVEATAFESPPVTGQVVVAQEVHNLRPRRYRATFVVGLVEGEFPARSTEPFPYTRQEREQLRQAGIDLTEAQGDAGDDLTQFYKIVSRTKEYLYLTHPRMDATGGELLPSYLIDEVRAVTGLEETYIQATAARSHDLLDERIVSLEELAWKTARGLLTDQFDKRASAAFDVLEKRVESWEATLRGAIVESERIAGVRAGRFSGVLNSEDLLDHLRSRFGPDHLWSASKLNDYGICPFRFFSSHALRLSPVEEPGEGFTPNQWGAALHGILEKLYLRLKDEGIRLEQNTCDLAAGIAEEVTEQELGKLIEEGRVKVTPLWDYEKADVKRRISMLLDKESQWNAERPTVPIAFEKKFGIGREEPLVVDDEDGGVKICGVVDRIDECEEGLVIIDYKTARTPIRHDDAVEGRNLQLPIYVMAASRVIKKNSRVASAYYLHINSRKKGSELPSSKDESLTIDALVSLAERHIRNYVKQARSGIFPVKPNRGVCPNYCEYDVMCRIQSLRDRGEE